MKVLFTVGAGYAGSTAAAELIQSGHEVVELGWTSSPCLPLARNVG